MLPVLLPLDPALMPSLEVTVVDGGLFGPTLVGSATVDLGAATQFDASQQRTDASGELFRDDRLRDVVVGARLQTGNHVVGVGLRRDHDDRHDALGAQRPTHVEARHAGQAQIEQHEVGWRPMELDETVLTVRRLADLVALVLERHRQCEADSVVVFDEQQ